MSENFEIEEDLQKQLWKVPVDLDLIEDVDLSHGAFRLYLMLMGYARTKNTCFPSIKLLSEKMGCTESHICKLKDELREHGLLNWTKSKWNDGRLHNTYILCSYKPIQKKVIQQKTDRYSADNQPFSTEYSNNTNNNNTNNKNSSTTSSAKAVKEHASVPVPAVAGGVEDLYNKYLPEVKIRKSDRLVLAKLDQDKLTAYIPYLPYFDDPFWNSATSTKQPCMLPAVWQALEKFVEDFSNTSAFHTLCKELKRQGIDVESIIEQAETVTKGKQEIIRRYL